MMRPSQLIILSGIFFAFINLIVKHLNYIHVFQIIFYRSIITFVICLFELWRKSQFNQFFTLSKKQHILLLLRGLFGTCALILFFKSIQELDLSTAVTLLYTAPFFTLILNKLINNEPVFILQWPFMTLSFIGVYLLKDANFIPSIGLVAPMGAAVMAAMAYVLIRKAGQGVNPLIVLLYFPFTSLVILTPQLSFIWQQTNLSETLLLVCIGVATHAAQYFMTMAYASESPSSLAHYNFLIIFWASLSGIFLFDEHFSRDKLMALLLITTGLLFNSLYLKQKSKKAV